MPEPARGPLAVLELPGGFAPRPEGGVAADGDRGEVLGFDLRPRRGGDPARQDAGGLRAVAQLTPGVAAPGPQRPVRPDAEEVDVTDVGAPPRAGDVGGPRPLRRR